MFVLKWGIAGTGKICNDFVVALNTIKEKKHEITAVVGRNEQKASEFASQHMINEYSNDFEYLAKHKNIDVVYIGVLNTEHYRLAKLMLENGKHVLLEKPMCMNLEETEEIIRIAKKHHCFLMEAIWSRCFPAYRKLREQITLGVIGEVHQVNANLGFPLTHIARLTSQELGGGSMLDLGVYVLQFCQFVFSGLDPIDIQASGSVNDEGVDQNVGIVIKYPNGKQAVLSVNAKVVMSNTAEVMGDRGFITVPNFWCPDKIQGPQGETVFPLPETKSHLNFFNSTGLAYEAEEVYQCISQGLMESPNVTLDESIKLAKWRDIIHKLIGKVDNYCR